MGASLSQCFSNIEEADQWAEQQARLAARWNLHKTVDVNTPVVRVPVIKPDGSPAEVAIPLEPAPTVDKRIAAYLGASARRTGYREDRSRNRQRAYIRSLRFD
jgi:hypothetical protein